LEMGVGWAERGESLAERGAGHCFAKPCKRVKLEYQSARGDWVWCNYPSTMANVARALRSVERSISNSQLTFDYSEDAPTNPRGIPRAIFIDRVEDYITDRSEVESTINSFKEMISYDMTPRGVSKD
jgi:hypothetical protein